MAAQMSVVKTTRALSLAALAWALAAPASAQIIATSIPKEFSLATGKALGEKKWAFHVMGTPFAMWNINSYFQEPTGTDNPLLQNVTSTDSRSKFLFAAEAAFKAGSDLTVGVGGWYNELGSAEVDFFQLNSDPQSADLILAGVAPFDLRVYEVHGNVFYKDIGVQVGLVRTRQKQTGLRAGTVDVFFDDFGNLVEQALTQDEFFKNEVQMDNNWDAFLIYKKAFTTGKRTSWGVSLGSGVYRDDEADSTNFTGFVTATVGIYKGLGLDASFWYVGGSKQTSARRDFQNLLDEKVKTDRSRFTVGIGYTFSK
jgi:hypothetical protein